MTELGHFFSSLTNWKDEVENEQRKMKFVVVVSPVSWKRIAMSYVTGASAVPTDGQIVVESSPRSSSLYAPSLWCDSMPLSHAHFPPVSLVCAMW